MFPLTLGRVEALVAMRLERREERAVLNQERSQLGRVIGRQPADHRATTRR
jgi:hypothetical protein